MRMNKATFGIFFLAIISSCGVPQTDYNNLKTENERLKNELNECNFGSEKIAATIEKAYSEKNFILARQNIELLSEKHPESPKNKEFTELLKVIEKEELVEKTRKELEEKEQVRLANINNTGIWSVGYYVDEFGEPTKKGYVRNTNVIRGTFSNTATQDSDLDVKLLITNSSDISIQLYEYAGNNPVKAYSPDSYTVLIQDKEGNRLKIRAVNYSERLGFDANESRKVHNALMKGGSLKFRITENDTPTTQYEFTIENADWYDNAYQKLKES